MMTTAMCFTHKVVEKITGDSAKASEQNSTIKSVLSN